MDEEQVLLINLSKGKLGEDASHLIGSLLMTSIGLAAFSRADIAENQRKPFFLYVDEFQNFTTLSIVNMASELRKYALALTISNQHVSQLDTDIARAIIGNVGTIICFRLGADDAVYLEKEFYPKFDKYDLMQLPNYEIYIRLMCDGSPTKPFSAVTLPT